MKKLLLLIMLIPNAFAHQIEVSKLEIYPDYDINFKLNDTLNRLYGQLDCQSFLKKFDFFDNNHKILAENYITMGECEYIYNNISQCLASNTTKCIDSNNIFNTACECDN